MNTVVDIIEKTEHQPFEVWHVNGNLNAATIHDIDMDELLDFSAVEPPYIIFDFTNAEILDSQGLNVLLRVLTATRIHSGDTWIINVPRHINKLLIITKLNSIFQIFNSIEEAKDYFKNLSKLKKHGS